MWMNRYDIEDSLRRFSPTSTSGRAAKFLYQFMLEVDSNSDGWPYWKAPAQAASKLMGLLHTASQYGTPDITEQEFKRALSPIKGFYTRKGYAAGMKFPEVEG